MKRFWLLLSLLLLPNISHAEEVNTELVIMLDVSTSVKDFELIRFRNDIYSALENDVFIKTVEDSGPIYLVLFEFAYDGYLETGNSKRSGVVKYAGTIKDKKDVLDTKETLFDEYRDLRGNTYTFTALEKVIDLITYNNVKSKQQRILVIGDGVADDAGYRSRLNYDKRFEPNTILENNSLSVMGLYWDADEGPNKVWSRLPEHFGSYIAKGSMKHADPFGKFTLEKYLVEAIRLYVY